jgi:hypothetical protein
MMQERDNKQIMRDFGLRYSRQLLAIAATMVLLLFLAWLHKYPDLFGNFSKNTILAAQIVLMAAFIGFSAFNWRCPLCKKYLGSDISRRICKHCGTKLR